MSLQFAVDAQNLNHAAIAAACWIAYDAVTTLEMEVQYIWRSAWSLPKATYLFSRYQGLLLSTLFAALSASQLSEKGCRVYTAVAAIGTVLVTIPADALLVMRVLSLFEDRKRLCKGLLIYYIVEKIVEFGAVCVAARFEVDYPAPDYSNATGCFHITSGQDPADALPALFAALLYNAVLFGLTLAKLAPYWRSGGYGLTPLLSVFITDGAVYFGMICCLLILEIVIPLFLSNRPALATILVPWLIAGYPIASCRLLLHLRGCVKKPLLDMTTIRTADVEIPTIRVPTELYSMELEDLSASEDRAMQSAQEDSEV